MPTLSAIDQLHLLPEGDAQLRWLISSCAVWKICCKINDEQTTLPGMS
ncbi:hypothetical protein ACNKHS_18350 [Shigella flexneri]